MAHLQHALTGPLLVKQIEDRVAKTGQQDAAGAQNAIRLRPNRPHRGHEQVGGGMHDQIEGRVVQI